MRNGCLPAILMSLGLCFGFIAKAIDFENVTPEKKSELERQFEQADFSSKDSELLKQKKWTCDMYGVRTRLQIRRGIKLYRWQDSDQPWHNQGAQVVRDYKPEAGQLVGHTDRFEDQVKITSQGRLISRLSSTLPDRQVVAYSVCDSQ